MKALIRFMCILCLIFSVTTPLLAGGIDNKHNFSAEYVRTLNRNAATDSADAVVYNPAGVVKMEDGLYLSISGQYALKDYSNTVGGIEYDTDEPDFVPSLFALYTRHRWAAFAAVTIPCGGGTVDYERGSATTLAIGNGIILGSGGKFNHVKSQRMEGESLYYGFTVGGAYALSDTVSASIGIRYIDAQIDTKGYAILNNATTPLVPDTTYSVDYEERGDGLGGIAGVNIAPTKELNIGVRYETKTGLDLETKERRDDINGITNGSKRKRDLPPLLGLGIACNIRPNVRAEANLTYYFNKDANWDDVGLTTADETQKSNGYDMGIALEYTFNPGVKGSLGYMYTETGIDPDNMSIEAPQLDAHTLAAGVAYEATFGLNLNFGVLMVFYDGETTTAGIKLEKKDMVMALGIQYKL
ncbi:MAG: outer membrane protein transport protein [Deltaproteobacteria bacterium]|nr:outer membrane protein transport protein [Deltaproteobacteria bacterium]